MNQNKLFIGLFLASVGWLSGSPSMAAEGIISKIQSDDGTYCFIKFPAIKEDTLFTSHPVLKDPSSGDVISYYGSCEHDPLGNEEIRRQRYLHEERRRRVPEGE